MMLSHGFGKEVVVLLSKIEKKANNTKKMGPFLQKKAFFSDTYIYVLFFRVTCCPVGCGLVRGLPG